MGGIKKEVAGYWIRTVVFNIILLVMVALLIFGKKKKKKKTSRL